MGLILNEYHDFIEYTLFHETTGEVGISEPIGWQEDSKEIIRDPKAHGKRIKVNSNLEFPDIFVEGRENSYQYIVDIFNLHGINALVTLTKYVMDPDDSSGNKKVIEYQMTFDYSTMELISDEAGRRLKISSKDEGIGQIIISRLNQQVEIERLTTLNGNSLPELNFDTVSLDGKEILLNSKYKETGEDANMAIDSKLKKTKSAAFPIPMDLVFSSDGDLFNPVIGQVEAGGGSGSGLGNGDTSLFHITSTKSVARVLDIDIELSFKFNVTGSTIRTSNKIARVDLVTYQDAFNTRAFKSRQTLLDIPQPGGQSGNIFNLSTSVSVPLLENEALSFQFYVQARLGDGFSNGSWNTSYTEIDCDYTITENSFFDKSQAKFLLPFELGERLSQIISDQKEDVFRSDFLGRTDLGHPEDGPGSLSGITTGMLIRGFDETDFTGSERKDKRFKTSLKDFLDTFNALWNTGWAIERIGFREYLRVEEMRYFYQNVVTVSLPNKVSNVKRTIAKQYFYSDIEVGNKKVIEPEENMALDEPNKQSTFSTIITRITNKLNLLHPYSSSMYNKEFARRKQKDLFPNEDTKYDLIKFILDLKRGLTDVFSQRKFADDFATAPTGIFDPESGTEYRFSPANTLLRSSWLIRVGLERYLNNKTRYTSTEGNSNMVTQLIGESPVSESGDFTNSTFEIPRFLPEEIEFEHEVDFKVLSQVEGKTTKSNGDVIENFYGLIEFNNEKNEKEYGYLLNLKPNKEGKWKLLKANR